MQELQRKYSAQIISSRFVGVLEACTRPLPLPTVEVPPEGRGRGIVQTVGGGMQFVSGSGAVSLSRGCEWNRCGEPSQALRASSPGGRAKGLVGIDGRSVKSRLTELLEVCTQLLPLPPGEVPPEGRGRGIVQTVGGGMQFVRGIGAVGLWVVCGWNWCGEPSQALRASSPGGRAKGGEESRGCGGGFGGGGCKKTTVGTGRFSLWFCGIWVA